MEPIYVFLIVQIPLLIYFIYREIAWWKWQKTFLTWVQNDYKNRAITIDKQGGLENFKPKLTCSKCNNKLLPTDVPGKYKCAECGEIE